MHPDGPRAFTIAMSLYACGLMLGAWLAAYENPNSTIVPSLASMIRHSISPFSNFT